MAKRYHKARSIKKKRSFLRGKWLWFFIFLLGFFSGAFYISVFSSFFQLQHIQTSGNASENAELQARAEQLLSQEVGFLNTKSILVLNLERIKTELLSQFPALASISLKRQFPNSLILVAQAREKVASWCADAEEKQCFALDEEGVIFLKENHPQGLRITLAKAVSTPVALGERLMEKDTLGLLLQFQKSMENFPLLQKDGAKVVQFTIFSSNQVRAKFSEGWEAYLDPEGDFNWEIAKLQVVLEKKIPSEKRKGLEYIDLRFGDQAYIKYSH
ncbi:MAG: hypothetical protein HYW95_00395 [Candidatus Wildermuthbacteria bacterium]|nr:hypothetical protein [Candidatus Wildermuthbacteria bacterium]